MLNFMMWRSQRRRLNIYLGTRLPHPGGCIRALNLIIATTTIIIIIMRVLDFIVCSLSRGGRVCSHVGRAVRFRPFLEETGSENSGVLSEANISDKIR